MDIFKNLDLLAVGNAIAAINILGWVVFFNNPKSVTSRSFLYFAFAASLWSLFNYFSYQTNSEIQALWFLRISMFFAVWYTFSLFQLFYVFPLNIKIFSRAYKFILVTYVFLVSVLTLTPLVFSGIQHFGNVGDVPTPEPAMGIVLFGSLVIGLLVAALTVLIKRMRKADKKDLKKYKLFLIGATLTFLCHIIFNFILPTVFDITRFIPLGAFFTFPFIGFTFYAIIRHSLLDIKVIATEVITYLILFFTFVEVVLSDSIEERILRIMVFIVLLIFSILLIKSVRKEVFQRIKLAELTSNLQAANDRLKELDNAKTEFLSITSHQLRTPLAGIRGYVSMLVEGDYGKFSDDQNKVLIRVYKEVERLIRLVQVFLNVSRIESGRLKIEKLDMDMNELVDTVVAELLPSAEEKGIKLEFNKSKKALLMKGDPDKLKDVVMNLIDNAIKYTEKGKIWVETKTHNSKVRVEVHDTGVGIDPEGAKHLFEKFSRGKGIAQVDASGTGLGLFIVKKIVEGHGGKVWAESEGLGKGSVFIVEL